MSVATGMTDGPYIAPLLDLGEGRIAAMDRDGIAVQLLLLTTPGVQHFDAATGTALARSANDQLADAISKHPSRYAGLAAVAPQDPRAAALEIERAITKLGLKGVVINSHTHGEYLDDPKFLPILEVLAALGVPLYIHPREPSPAMAAPLMLPAFTVGWGFGVETGTHALRLIASGVFDRLPRLRIVLGHLGETLPFVIERIDDRYRFESKMPNVRTSLKRLPGEYFREHFTITSSGMNFSPQIATCQKILGADRVMFAVDYPFEEQGAAVRAAEATPMDDTVRRKFFEDNARRVFAL